MKRRIALAMLLVFAAALVGSGSATAVETTPAITIDKMLQTGELGYYEPGDSITYRYEVGGNDRFINVAVTDNTCSPVNPVLAGDGYNVGDTIAPKGALNGLAGEVWVYTCTTTAPAWVNPGSSSTNTGHVEAISPTPGWDEFQGITWTDEDTFTLKAVALRKAVFLFWNYNVGIPDPGAGDVDFTVDVKESGNIVGTETVSVNDPLYLWLAPGTWQLKEQTPPTGYRVFDGRDTWNVNLADTWRDNSFINGADFDLAIEKSGPDFAYGGATVTYTYTVTNAGPGVVTPVVTDNKCSPVTYFSGDTALHPGKIDPTETWTFKCTYTPNWGAAFPNPLTNTSTVVAGEADDLSPAYDGGPIFGGDTNTANNTDTFTLGPYVIRKDVIEWGTGHQLTDPTTFTVTIKQGSTVIATVQIKEGDPTELWLVPGTYTFCETVLPFYIPNHECWTQTVGIDYPDWTVVNAHWYGFSHGYYKNQGHRIGWQSLTPPVAGTFLESTTLENVFDVPDAFGIDGVTLYEALSFQGGPDPSGKAEILLKQAVAALLNESRFGASFGDFTLVELIADVNAALAGSESDMTHLAGVLDYWNNGVVV